MNEDAFNEWDDLKHERVLFQERMDYLATRILDGKNNAFKDALSDYLQRFDPGAMGYQSPASKPSQKIATEQSPRCSPRPERRTGTREHRDSK